MQEIQLPEITRDDVLAGFKTVDVKLRDGGTPGVVKVHALPWRMALLTTAMLARGEDAEGVIKILQQSVKLSDEYLDTLVPAELSRLANIALRLTNGVSEKNGSAGTPEASPALPISGKSNVSCAPEDSEMRPG